MGLREAMFRNKTVDRLPVFGDEVGIQTAGRYTECLGEIKQRGYFPFQIEQVLMQLFNFLVRGGGGKMPGYPIKQS